MSNTETLGFQVLEQITHVLYEKQSPEQAKNNILSLIRELVQNRLLADKDKDELWARFSNDPVTDDWDNYLAQAQMQAILKALEEPKEVKE